MNKDDYYYYFQGSWLYQSTQLMTNLKMAQLKEQLKKEQAIKQREKAKAD